VSAAAAARWPSVTTVVATRGRPVLLRRALASIAGQDYPGAMEIIVVFDQTTIDVLEDLRPLVPEAVRLRCVANVRTPGLAGARNTGIDLSTSDLVAFCDDDDEWLPQKLTRQVELRRSHPGAVVLATGIRITTDRGSRVRTPPEVTHRADLLRSRVSEIHPSALVFDRAALTTLDGPVDEALPASYGEDYDLLLRIATQGEIASVPEALVVVHWDRPSFFAGKWAGMANGLTYLLAKHPGLRTENRNAARMTGQIAFARAAEGDRGAARRWALQALRHRWREPRAWMAFAIGCGLVRPAFVVRSLNYWGKGI